MKLLLVLIAPLLLAACVRDDTTYPSLAPRAAEKQGFAEPAAPPPVSILADPALDAKLAEAGARLDGVANGFGADAARAANAADAAGARTVGSEGWIAAQTALAALDDWRAQASNIATEADDLARERIATAGAPYPALDQLRQRAGAEAEREAAAIALLSAKLPLP